MRPSVLTLLVVLAACGGSAQEQLSGPTAAADSTAAQACVDHINALRNTLGLPALARWDGAETCADGQAESDSETGIAHGAFGKCEESGQCECPGWNSLTGNASSIVPGCLDMMWAEGPPTDGKLNHYEIMTSTSYTMVSCGFYTTSTGSVWAVQDYR